MAKRIPKGQINKRNMQTVKALVNLMHDIDQKYSIRVGIIGEQAYAKHEGSNLTNGELGAVHEFGATINVTDKMRAYLHYNDIHLRPDTNTVIIPTRSFLRMPLLGGSFKEILMQRIQKEGLALVDVDGLGKDQEAKDLVRWFNMENAKEAIEKEGSIIHRIAGIIAAEALSEIELAFKSSGWGKWPPISEVTKQNRTKDKTSPPLTDTGELRDSINAEVKRVK